MVNIFKKPSASPVQAVDERLDEIRVQMQAAASEQASVQASIDVLTEEMRTAIEDGRDTSEIETKIVAARVGLERLALRHVMLEKVAREKSAVLREKRHRLRVEALTQAETDGHTSLTALDEEIIEIALTLSEKFGRRLKLEHDLAAVNGRLQHLGRLPRGAGDLGWSETALVAEFLRVHREEAMRPVSFGEQPWGPFTLTLPTLTPNRTTTALVADDEANASA